MSLKQTLLDALNKAAAARDKASDEYNRHVDAFDLTDAGKERELTRLQDGITGPIAEAKAAGLQAIDQKIAELDRIEGDRASVRARDTERLTRLNLKLDYIKAVDLSKLPDAALKILFEEYKDDTLSLEVLKATIMDPMRAVEILPSDNTGVSQARLRRYRDNFESCMNMCQKLIDETNRESVIAAVSEKAIIKNLVTCISLQDENFSRPDEEVAAEAREAGAEPTFNFQFNKKG